MPDGLITVQKPEKVTLADYLGKPVIIDPIGEADRNSNWKTTPWRVMLWVDNGKGYEATEMLIFAKAIVDSLKAANGKGFIAGIVTKEGSQFWIDSSNPLIMNALTEAWADISVAKS